MLSWLCRFSMPCVRASTKVYNKVYSVYKDLLFSEMLWLLLELLNYNEFFPSYIHGQDQAE